MKLTIKDKEVELKYTFRAMMMYENIKNESFAPKTLTDVMIFMLCAILASDKTIKLTFDELLDIVDNDPTILEDFSNWLTSENSKQNLLSQDTEVVVDKEKKTSLS